jgi:hypothetical protein
MQASSIHTKQSLIMIYQIKCNAMIHFSQEFRKQFLATFELGLPPPWNPQIWFLNIEGYNDYLEKERNKSE